MEALRLVGSLLAPVQYELLLFALAGLLIGGLDDLAMDLMFIARAVARRLFVYTRHKRMTAATLPASEEPGTIAVFVPAWRESEVIGLMLRSCIARWRKGDFRIFVGVYPNDWPTIDEVRAMVHEDERVRLVVLPHPGGTTKADCLNHIWAAMEREEARGIM